MSTYDDRLTAVEQGLAPVRGDFLVHLRESNRQMATLNKVISAQELNGRDVDHNLTILLGVTSEQGRDIKSIKLSLEELRNQQDIQGQDIKDVKQHLYGLDQRLTSLDGKLERVLQILIAPPGIDE